MTNTKQLSQYIFLVFITALLMYLCWQMIAPFIYVILWSVILVVIFFPIYKKLRSKTGKHFLSAVITIAISLLTFIIPGIIVITAAVNEVAAISDVVSEQIHLLTTDPEHSSIAPIYNYINQFINIKELIKPEDIKVLASKLSALLLSATLSVIEGSFSILVGTLFAVFSMFYLFRDGEKIVKDIPEILPFDKEQGKELIRETLQLIDATIRGSLFVALVQGILAAIIFGILGIPAFILLGLLTMLFALVPIGGTAFVTVPVTLGLLFNGDYTKAIILTVYAALVIGMIDNFLLPKLIKQKVKMNELLVFFGVIGGLQLFGIIGIFLGPIIFVFAIGLFKIFRGKKIDKENITVE